MTKVIFYPVRTTSAKLTKLLEIATTHFHKAEPLLFLVPDEAAWEFLNNLFWSTPPESFLPHPCRLIQIRHTLSSYPLEPPPGTVFNLCPTPVLHENLKILYELEDSTSAEKLKASQQRYHAYRERSFQIIVET